MAISAGGALAGSLGAAAIGLGPVGLLAGAAAGGLLAGEVGGGGGGQVGFQQIPQTEEATEARKRLLAIATGKPPEVPRRQIAPLPPITEERQIARETAKELVQPQDIFSLPEVQGIIQEARETGNLLANRLSRMLQSAGSLTATTGRDVLGRAVTDVQSRLAASLAPFAAEERGRRERLIPELERLGLTEELRRQGFTQEELDALFRQETAQAGQLQSFTIPLLQSIIGLQPGIQPIIQGQQPSSITEFAPLIGPLLTSILSRGTTTPTNFPLQPEAPLASPILAR